MLLSEFFRLQCHLLAESELSKTLVLWIKHIGTFRTALAFLTAGIRSLPKVIDVVKHSWSPMPMKGLPAAYLFSICGFIKAKHYLEGFLEQHPS